MADPCNNTNGQTGQVAMNSLDPDYLDYAFLTAARFFFVSFSEASEDAWVSTMLSPESFFPGANSAEMMRRTLGVVHEMRLSRQSMFSYSNPRCLRCSAIVTADERHLLQMVQHVRAGRHSAAVLSAMMLCEGNDTDRMLHAVRRFAEMVKTTASAGCPG